MRGLNNRGLPSPYVFSAGLLTLSISLFAPKTQAIVNIEGVRHGGTQQGLSGLLNLSFSGASGNSDKSAVTSKAQLVWQQQQAHTLLLASYHYGASNRVRDTNKTFVHLRHVIKRNDTWSEEGFVQAERNEFTRMSLRALVGGGLRQTLYSSPEGQIHLGGGAFYSSEKFEEDPSYSDGGTEKLWRANIYLALGYSLNETVKLESTSYYQPSLKNSADYRLLEQAAASFSINDSLSLRLTLDIAHDNEPPQTIDKTDINYLTGIEYRF